MDGVIAAIRSRYGVVIENVEVTREDVIFRLPRNLRDAS